MYSDNSTETAAISGVKLTGFCPVICCHTSLSHSDAWTHSSGPSLTLTLLPSCRNQFSVFSRRQASLRHLRVGMTHIRAQAADPQQQSGKQVSYDARSTGCCCRRRTCITILSYLIPLLTHCVIITYSVGLTTSFTIIYFYSIFSQCTI